MGAWVYGCMGVWVRMAWSGCDHHKFFKQKKIEINFLSKKKLK